MNSEFEEEIREFLIESNENLELLDQQIVQLEQQPDNPELISSVFRTIHSIKGTCGFFGFDILGAVTHITESILGQLRERKRTLTPELITLILESVDAVKQLLQNIEANGEEGEDRTEALRGRLEEAYRSSGSATTIQGMLREIATQETAAPEPGPAQDPVPEATLPVAPVVPPPAAQAAMPALVPVATPSVVKELRPPAAPSAAENPEAHVADSTIRVDVNLLNQLMNLVGELVLTRNQLLQSGGNFSPGLQQTSQRLNGITTELQASVMKTRMQPVGVVWSKLPRVVRDLSAKCGKQIHLDMQGAETELDKSLIEAIRDPLTHIVRNSCDHGIETPEVRVARGKPALGTLSLRAFHEAGAVNIEIVDDGAGIDPERVRAKAVEKRLITPEQAAGLSAADSINLIFLPGFSTAQQVTSISGRGVGMDVVKTNIEKISGTVAITCPPSGGTTLRIKIPLTLAIIPGLIVACDAVVGSADGNRVLQEERFVIPQSHLVEMARIDLTGDRLVHDINGASVLRHRGNLLSLIDLSALLYGADPARRSDSLNTLILQVQGKHFGLVVDRICDTQEIVVKPLGKQLKQVPCYGGATIMGDGRPALILDIGGIVRQAGLEAQGKEPHSTQAPKRPHKTSSEFLLFRAGTRRLAIPLSIVNRLEELPSSEVESAEGHLVARYRGELLPLRWATQMLDGVPAEPATESGKVSVVVINNGARPFGLVIDEIVDIVDESLAAMRSSGNPSMLGSAVIGGFVTDILDIAFLCADFGSFWNRPSAETSLRRIAFFNPWALSREMMRTLLDMAGYLPVHIASAAELKDALQRDAVDLVVLDAAPDQAGETHALALPEWLEQARRPGGLLAGVPTVVLHTPAAGPVAATMAAAMTSDLVRVDRRDRVALLQAIENLTRQPARKAA